MQTRALVLLGDVAGSRRAQERAAAWLDRLALDLNGRSGEGEPVPLRPFRRVRGDEIEGVLHPAADPLRPILVATLGPETIAVRWALAAGPVEVARQAAREALAAARERHDLLVVRTGAPGRDSVVADVAPALFALLGGLTPRQREITRMILVDRSRQVDVAAALGISRATVSVAVARGGVRALGRLLEATRALLREGLAAGEAGLGSGDPDGTQPNRAALARVAR